MNFLVFDLETMGLEYKDEIVAIGWLFNDGGEVNSDDIQIGQVPVGATEETLLMAVLDVLAEAKRQNAVLCGYNCDQYDKKMLLARGFKYDLDFTPLLQMRMIDLYWLVKRFMSPTGKGTLGEVAKFFDIQHDESLQGGDVMKWFEDGEYEKIADHLRDDVLTTCELLKKLMPLVQYDLKVRYRNWK